MPIASIQDIVADLRDGKMVVLVDEEDRENEGDLVIAADRVTAEAINFMARYGRGLVCLTLTEERARRLNLPLMTGQNRSAHGTNFTVSIEAASGVTTGISAADRAHTVRVAVARDATPADIVQPGHIFPIIAQPGGVLARAGHTEAGCDLTRARRHDARGGHLRDPQGRRHDGAPSRSGDVRARARIEDRCDHRPDPLPQPHREAGRAHRRAPAGHAGAARSGSSSTATSCPTRRISRWCADRCRANPRRSCASTSRCR